MDVFDAVLHAIDVWLKDITIKENQLMIVERKLRRNILQIRYEGFLSITEVAELEKISDLWLELLHSLGGDKNVIVNRVLKLFYYDQISLELANRIIVKVC